MKDLAIAGYRAVVIVVAARALWGIDAPVDLAIATSTLSALILLPGFLIVGALGLGPPDAFGDLDAGTVWAGYLVSTAIVATAIVAGRRARLALRRRRAKARGRPRGDLPGPVAVPRTAPTR